MNAIPTLEDCRRVGGPRLLRRERTWRGCPAPAAQGPHRLAGIGPSRAQARAAAARPFWRR